MAQPFGPQAESLAQQFTDKMDFAGQSLRRAAGLVGEDLGTLGQYLNDPRTDALLASPLPAAKGVGVGLKGLGATAGMLGSMLRKVDTLPFQRLAGLQRVKQFKDKQGKLIPDSSSKFIETPIQKLPLREEQFLDDQITREAQAVGLSRKEFVKDFATEETIPIDFLSTTQHVVSEDNIRHFLSGGQSGEAQLPLIYQFGGKLIAVDGNHRLVAAMLRGEKTVKARVVFIPDK